MTAEEAKEIARKNLLHGLYEIEIAINKAASKGKYYVDWDTINDAVKQELKKRGFSISIEYLLEKNSNIYRISWND